MSDTIIKVENLSKKYIIGHQQEGSSNYTALRDVISNGAKSLIQKIKHPTKSSNNKYEDFWALNDVSFEIKRGEAVGIIGRNGAGKSTLLKILSRITEPTKGKVSIKGRVASLLEVGTGFHPELTGRENIYLNGAILGMSQVEIKRKFDEIVDFSEVEKFLDTPVKRYSSGMYVRLAFAVAAHLEPEILVVDEVLAVGDAAFQKKCLGKMGDVATKEGRTVLFVSHNMAAVEKLCQRGILLNRGNIQFIGEKSEAISQYLANFCSESTFSLNNRQDRKGTGEIMITGIEIKDEQGQVLDTVHSGQNIDIYLYFDKKVTTNISQIIVSLAVKNNTDVPVFLQHNRLTRDDFGLIPEKGAFVCKIDKLPIPSSNYYCTYSILRDGTYLDTLENAFQLSVVDGNFYGSGEVPPVSHGVCFVNAHWRLEQDKSSFIHSSVD